MAFKLNIGNIKKGLGSAFQRAKQNLGDIPSNLADAPSNIVENIQKGVEGFTQENNPFKKLSEDLQSIKKPSIKGTNIKEGMAKKYGIGDFATGGDKAAQRMKPGESQHQYNVRMQGTNKVASDPGLLEQEITDISDLTKEEQLALGASGVYPETNPNDKRPQEDLLNYGITEGMSFDEAFAQAGEMGATSKPEDAFSWTDPGTGETKKFLYEFGVGDVAPPN